MILITGGSGFIGSHFHRYLKDQPLTNLDLNRPAFEAHSSYIQGDIRIESDVKKAIAGREIKTIISLAAKHHDFGIGHDEYFDTNEDGTAVICKVAADNDIKQIIFYSSVAVYGMRQETSTEAMEPRPDGPYGASKLAGEKVLRAWAAADPTRKLLIIRPTVVFGPGNMANMNSLIRQIDSGVYFHVGKADNIKSIAYVENVVAATLHLMNRMEPGVSIYNYADEPQLTTREIGEHIARFLSKKIIGTVPKPLALLMSKPFDLAIRLTGRNLAISSARIEKLATQTHHSAQKLFAAGFRPQFTTIEGLAKMVEWYKSEK